jgi:hypothetical protein
MPPSHFWFAFGLGIIGSAITAYIWLAQFMGTPVPSAPSREAAAFAQAPIVFFLYVLCVCASLLLGPGSLKRAIEKNLPSTGFNIACLAVAASGIWLSKSIGHAGLGGSTMSFYWWALAMVWLFLMIGIGFAHKTNRPLVVRDWVIYSHGLTLLPPLTWITFALFNAFSSITPDEAMITAVTLPFAGVFVLAHWYILDVVEHGA